ncbi:amino acid ABC transporter substrate-binding protein [Acinetobacter nectaris]|uniref:amino acid ABC transporter substrate-binding protein n=1 Tax=Acinetobacter nectaris TaxID=1219382 RepID=UPI001F378FCB|nr:amino acid ABC transporter substrate-binding protein [Acinetobacter nectaris]MCF8999305.1 amino acid ABC transporter substrate-binding protein [Acinetobacter nectaris]MCF9028088.1 amino acid ABC transporter substrate-binding protein [Acinetobacter nectaris]
MNKPITFILLSIFLGSVTAQANAESTLERIKNSGKIVVGYRDAAEPISYTVNGSPKGYAIDVCNNVISDIKKTLNKPNLGVEYRTVYPMTRVPDILTGRIDLECGTTTNTIQRQEVVDFSTSYFMTEVRVAVKNSAHINTIDGLAGKAVATTKGTTSDRYMVALKRNNTLDIKNIFGSDNNETFALLASGRATGLAMDDNTLAGLIAKSEHASDYKMIGPVLSKEPYGVMIAKNNPQLKAIVDHAITQMWTSGNMSKLYKKWFQSPIPPNNMNLNMLPSSSFKELEKQPNADGVDLS